MKHNSKVKYKPFKEMPCFLIYVDGRVYSRKTKRFLKPQKTLKGYLRLSLRDYRNEKRANKFVHVLVAESFIPNPDKKPQVNHIDGNKMNNNVSNLEWVTSKENAKHARIHNLIAKGSKIHTSKLLEEEVVAIRLLYSTDKYSHTDIAKMFGIHKSVIGKIVTGKIWRHLMIPLLDELKAKIPIIFDNVKQQNT